MMTEMGLRTATLSIIGNRLSIVEGHMPASAKQVKILKQAYNDLFKEMAEAYREIEPEMTEPAQHGEYKMVCYLCGNPQKGILKPYKHHYCDYCLGAHIDEINTTEKVLAEAEPEPKEPETIMCDGCAGVVGAWHDHEGKSYCLPCARKIGVI